MHEEETACPSVHCPGLPSPDPGLLPGSRAAVRGPKSSVARKAEPGTGKRISPAAHRSLQPWPGVSHAPGWAPSCHLRVATVPVCLTGLPRGAPFHKAPAHGRCSQKRMPSRLEAVGVGAGPGQSAYPRALRQENSARWRSSAPSGCAPLGWRHPWGSRTTPLMSQHLGDTQSNVLRTRHPHIRTKTSPVGLTLQGS